MWIKLDNVLINDNQIPYMYHGEMPDGSFGIIMKQEVRPSFPGISEMSLEEKILHHGKSGIFIALVYDDSDKFNQDCYALHSGIESRLNRVELDGFSSIKFFEIKEEKADVFAGVL